MARASGHDPTPAADRSTVHRLARGPSGTARSGTVRRRARVRLVAAVVEDAEHEDGGIVVEWLLVEPGDVADDVREQRRRRRARHPRKVVVEAGDPKSTGEVPALDNAVGVEDDA